MSYAQTNYPQIQGINGIFTIAEIGCFNTAFCNLENRFRRPIDPLSLNGIFRDRGIYVDVDDGIRDDLAWSSITQYDPDTVVTATGRGAPPSNDAIVKFIYKSYRTGQDTTHFCLTLDAAAGTIIDSWDGQVKSWNVYGGPKEWATYANQSSPQGGNDVVLQEGDVQVLYRKLFNREGDPGGVRNYTGKTLEFTLQDMLGSDEFRGAHTIDRVVERVVEKPVEVIKEVPGGTQADPDGQKWRDLKALQKELAS